MHRNPAATRTIENSESMGIAGEISTIPLDRRVSVAPMMDWSD
jgi:hypothetical protein